MFKKIGAIAALLIGSSTVALAQSQQTVSFMAFDAVNFRGALEDFIAEFEKANPDVDIVPTFSPQLFDQFVPMLQANSLSDITFIASGSFIPYLASGRIQPIPDEFAAKLTDALNPASLGAVSREGKIFAVPYNYYPSSGVIMLNDALWEQAGIKPSDAKTWDELMTMAQAVTKTDASGRMTQSGFSGQRSVYNIFVAWLLQLGGKPFNPDGTAAFNSEAGAAALQQFADVYQKWHVDDYEFGATIDNFNKGLVAATMVGPWYGAILAKEFPDIRVGYINQPPLPGVKAGQPNYWALPEVWAHVVSAEGAKKDGVWRFLDYLIQPEVAARWSAFSGEMPTVTKALEFPEVTSTPYIAPYIDALQYGVSDGVTAYLSEDVTTVIETMMESVGRGQTSIQDALATAEQEVNRLTARMVQR